MPALSGLQSASTPGEDRRRQGSSAASARVPQLARAVPQQADAGDPLPGWQAFAQTQGQNAAEGAAVAAAAAQAAPKLAAGWGDGLPGAAPGGAAWALSGSRRAAVAAQGREGRGSAAHASAQLAERSRDASASAAAVLPAQAPTAPVDDVAMRSAQGAVLEGPQGAKAAAPGVGMQEAEMQRLHELLRCGVVPCLLVSHMLMYICSDARWLGQDDKGALGLLP